MSSPNQTARIAGALYFVVVLTGLFSLMYVPSKISDWNQPEIMINNIVANETLFRLGIAAGIFGYIVFALLPLALYKLLSQVNKTHAVLIGGLSLNWRILASTCPYVITSAVFFVKYKKL